MARAQERGYEPLLLEDVAREEPRSLSAGRSGRGRGAAREAGDLGTSSGGGGRSGRGAAAGHSGRLAGNYDPMGDAPPPSNFDAGGGALYGGFGGGGDGEGYRPTRTVGRSPRRTRGVFGGLRGVQDRDSDGQRRAGGGGAQRLHERL